MNFSNCDLLTLSSESRFLGDGIFRIGRTTNLTIEGNVLDLTNLQGVSGVLSGVESLINTANDFQPVILNGINFGSGKVNSLSFNNGNYVRSTRYTCSISVFDSGNLYNMTGSYYSGLQNIFNVPQNNTPLIRNLQETFSFQVNRANEYSYDYQCSVGLYSGIGTNPLQTAINVVSGLFYSSPPFGFINNQWSGFYQKQGKTYVTENYNLITNEVNIGKRFQMISNSGCYGIQLKHTMQTNEDGITSVQENGEIQGVCNPIYASALSGIAAEVPKSFGRCSGMFYYYIPSGSYQLNTEPISKNTILDSFNGKINYTIAYTNNPFFYTGYYWEYTQSIEEQPDTIINVSENGLIRGYGKLNTPEKFNRAVSGYNVVVSGIPQRASGFYFDYTSGYAPLHLLNNTQGRSPYRGEITYSQILTDDLTFVDDPYVQKSTVVINKILPKHIFQAYNILNQKEIVQMGSNTELEQSQIQISLNTHRTAIFNRDYFLAYCQAICLNYKTQLGAYSNVFYRDVNYNFSDIQGNFDFSLTYLGAKAKAYDDLNLDWP